MGCDIHAHVEVKIDGKWHHYSAPVVPRNYTLFTLLAGVRKNYEIEFFSEPRGMPNDATLITKLDLKRDWFHSHSYIVDHEIVDVEHKWNEYLKKNNLLQIDFDFNHVYFGYIFGNSFNIDEDDFDFDDPVRELESVRIIFAFDS